MKEITKVSFIFALLFMLFSCVTALPPVPEKYNFDNHLEVIDKISTYKVSRWDQIDSQSIKLRVNWNDYYLLVLDRPITSRYNNLDIGVTRTASSIATGFDRIVVLEHDGPDYYYINKIYRLKDREQARAIIEKLTRK